MQTVTLFTDSTDAVRFSLEVEGAGSSYGYCVPQCSAPNALDVAADRYIVSLTAKGYSESFNAIPTGQPGELYFIPELGYGTYVAKVHSVDSDDRPSYIDCFRIKVEHSCFQECPPPPHTTVCCNEVVVTCSSGCS